MIRKLLFGFMLITCVAFSAFSKDAGLQDLLKNASAELCVALDGSAKVIAVVEVNSGYWAVSEYIEERLNHEIAGLLKQSALAVRDAHSLELIKSEISYQNSGEVSDKSILSVGQALGADCLVFGTVKESSGGFQITVRAVSVESKRVMFSWSGGVKNNDKDMKFQITKSSKSKSGAENAKTELDKNEYKQIATTYKSSSTCKDIADIFIQELRKREPKIPDVGPYVYQRKTGGYVISPKFSGVYAFMYKPCGDDVDHAWEVGVDDPYSVCLGTRNAKIRAFFVRDKKSEQEFFDEYTKKLSGDGWKFGKSHRFFYKFLVESSADIKRQGKALSKDEIEAFDKIIKHIARLSNYAEGVYRNGMIKLLCDLPLDGNLFKMYLDTGCPLSVNGEYFLFYLCRKLNEYFVSVLDYEDHEGLYERIKFLLESGKVNINERTSDGNSLLHVFVNVIKDTGSYHPFGCNFNKNECPVKFIKLFLQYGANVNAKNDNGYTPLMLVNYYLEQNYIRYDLQAKSALESIKSILMNAGAEE